MIRDYFALIGCVSLLGGALWFATRLVRRGGAVETPAPVDYGDVALERLPRAPSLPPPGHEELRVTVPEVPRKERG